MRTRSLLAALAVVAAVGAASADAHVARFLQAGSVGIETSRAGSLFDLESLTPGARAEARVTVRNSGTLAARWQLKATMRGDVAFLQRLRLTVREVDGAHRRVVFAGPLGSLTSIELGAVAAGENRRYAFSVSWPPRRQAEVPGPERAAVDFAWLAHSLR